MNKSKFALGLALPFALTACTQTVDESVATCEMTGPASFEIKDQRNSIVLYDVKNLTTVDLNLYKTYKADVTVSKIVSPVIADNIISAELNLNTKRCRISNSSSVSDQIFKLK